MAPLESFLRGTAVASDASPETVSALAAAGHARSLHAGDAVFRRDDAATDLVLVRRGIVQIVRPGTDPMTLGIFGPRETIGLSAMLERSSYPADAIAASDAEIVRVPGALVLDAMERDNGLARSINRALLDHTRALQAKIAMLTAGEVSARLETLLAHLAERFGDVDDTGATFVPLVLSRGDLARLVGARAETVIRVMSAWQKAGSLETTAEGFRIAHGAALH